MIGQLARRKSKLPKGQRGQSEESGKFGAIVAGPIQGGAAGRRSRPLSDGRLSSPADQCLRTECAPLPRPPPPNTIPSHHCSPKTTQTTTTTTTTITMTTTVHLRRWPTRTPNGRSTSVAADRSLGPIEPPHTLPRPPLAAQTNRSQDRRRRADQASSRGGHLVSELSGRAAAARILAVCFVEAVSGRLVLSHAEQWPLAMISSN
jgi:hypothetical protein